VATVLSSQRPTPFCPPQYRRVKPMGAPGLVFETWDPSNQFPLEAPTLLFVIRSVPGFPTAPTTALALGNGPLLSATLSLFVIPSVPGFPAALLSSTTPDVVLFKENHTQPAEVATLDRKSGEAEGSAVRHSCAPPLPAHTHGTTGTQEMSHAKHGWRQGMSGSFPWTLSSSQNPPERVERAGNLSCHPVALHPSSSARGDMLKHPACGTDAHSC
jgi:hypothetical protein